MEDRSPSRSQPPSSPPDPLLLLSPPRHRRLSPPPSPPPPQPSRSPLPSPLPKSTSAIEGLHRGESPLKRPRLSLPEGAKEVGRGGEEGGKEHPSELANDEEEVDQDEDSDVVPTSDTEEQETLLVDSRGREESIWEQATRRGQAWEGRFGGGSQFVQRSPSLRMENDAELNLPSSRAQPPSPPASTSLPSSRKPLHPTPSPSAAAPLVLPSPLAPVSLHRNSIAGPSRLGYQPPLPPPSPSKRRSSPSPSPPPPPVASHEPVTSFPLASQIVATNATAGPSWAGQPSSTPSSTTRPQNPFATAPSPEPPSRPSPSPPGNAVAGPSRLPASPFPLETVTLKFRRSVAQSRTSTLEQGELRESQSQSEEVGQLDDASMEVDEEQRAAVGESQSMLDEEMEYGNGDMELPYYTPSPHPSLPNESQPRSRSSTPRPRDSTLPFAGTSSVVPDLDPDPLNFFASFSQQPHHHSQSQLPDSPESSHSHSNQKRRVESSASLSPPPQSPQQAALSSILTPALTANSSPPAGPSAAAAALGPVLPPPPLLSQPHADDDPQPDPQEAYVPQRVFRERTSLQLNPYTRERAQYQYLLARGGNKLAIVNAREEAEAVRRANGGGAAPLDPSLLGGWLVVEEEEREKERKRKEKGKGRADAQEEQGYSNSGEEEESQEAVAEKKKKHKELSREEMERLFGSAAVAGLLSSSDGEGDEVERERRKAGLGRKKQDKGKGKEPEKDGKGKEKEKKKVRIKKPKPFPMQELLGGGVEAEEGVGESSKGGAKKRSKGKTYSRRRSASPRRPFRDDRSPPPLPPPRQRSEDRLPNRAFDDYPPDNFDNGASPSPPRVRAPAATLRRVLSSSPPEAASSRRGRQLSRRAGSKSSSSSSSSNPNASSDSDDSSSTDRPTLDHKRSRILGRMLPAVAINNLRKDHLAKEARRQAARAGNRTSEGPIKAGQSVVRRGNGTTVTKPRKVVDVSDDSDLDASDPEVSEGQAFYHRENARMDRGNEIDERLVEARYGAAVGAGFESISEEDEDEMSSAGEAMREREESEEAEFEDADIRDWLVPLGPGRLGGGGLARSVFGGGAASVFGGESIAGGRAPSVVDQMLSRTAATSRPRVGGLVQRRRVGGGGGGVGGARAGRGGGGGARRPQQQNHHHSSVSGSSARNRTGAATAGSFNTPSHGVVQLGRHKPKPKSKSNVPPRHRARNAGPPKVKRPPPIVLDDDSIFGGDFGPPPPRGQDENVNARPPARRFLPPPRPAARGVRPPAPPAIPLRPRQINEQDFGTPPSQSRSPEPVAGRQVQQQPQQQQQQRLVDVGPVPLREPTTIDGVTWTSYAKFSLDFEILPLRTGVSFPNDSDISKGRLWELVGLVNPTDDPAPLPLPQPCSVFELELSPEMSRIEFAPVFGIITDRLFEVLEKARTGQDDEEVEGEIEARDAMRFACLFVSQQVPDADFIDVFKPAIQGFLDQLFGRMETFSVPTSSKRVAETRIFFSLHWFAVELSTRFDILEGLEPQFQASPGFVVLLIRRLLAHGFNRTVKSVKVAQISREEEDAPSLKVQDFTAQLWVGTIHLASALDSRELATGPSSFWTHLANALEASGSPQNNLLAAEQIWYLVHGLTSLSQFSSLGTSRPKPMLSSSWSLITKAVSSVRLESDVVTDRLAPSSALSKRDQYIWTILGRLHLLLTRWKWKLDGQENLLGYLVQKIFKSRKFIKLRSDPTSDFPLFIRESNQSLILKVDEESDSSFDIFLKILALTVRDIKRTVQEGVEGGVTQRQAERSIVRLLNLSAPIGKTPFTRTTPPSMTELSMLINRYTYSLFSILLDPSPPNAVHCIRQMRFYLRFDEGDFKSRKICIRAMMYIAILLRQVEVDLGGVVDWFAEMTETLLKEAARLERPPTPATNGSERRKSPGVEASTTPKSEIIWSMLLLLGSIRNIICIRGMNGEEEGEEREEESPSYPDPILLHPSWTQGILLSPLASDPRIGLEVIKCVQSFLDTRQAYLLSNRPLLHGGPQPNGESQDEYGAEFDRIDLDDPALRALLDGTDAEAEPEVEDPQALEETRRREKVGEMEKVFAGVVKERISPAIYKLLSNLFAGGGVEGLMEGGKEKEAYVDQLVDCWAGCASVLVQQKDQDWSSYLELGPESWKRIGDSAAKRQVGLRFLYNVGSLDPGAYEPLKEHFIPIFFQAIMVPSSRLTIEPDFCSLVLNLDSLTDLFADLPLEKNEEDGRFVLDLDLFEVKRVDILSEIFANIYLELSRNAAGNSILQQRKAFLVSCIREMLLTMTDHLSTLTGPPRAQYLALCSAVLEAMRERAGLALNVNSLRELKVFEGMR
ncbi:Mus7/MMS22 family-domain-containing protein [Mrakia frigida]|uniref:Mus7/MMS22 family-domain-containing protein n=1 Tax=Mrakia frigida TaxID=29902 RepID=UPI003FCC18DF